MSSFAAYCLSGRPDRLPSALSAYWANVSLSREGPLFLYYFRGSHTRRSIDEARRVYRGTMHVRELDPRVPSHIENRDLFFHKKHEYARTFGRKRLNYLHMEHFVSNPQELDDLKSYEFTLRFDDDSDFIRPVPLNFKQLMNEHRAIIGSAELWSRDSDRVRQVRENLFDFTRHYCLSNSVVPQHSGLAKAILNDDEAAFHQLMWTAGNFNLYRHAYFLTPEWANWIGAVNHFGGQYRYRWGDQEILGIFAYMYSSSPLVNFGMVRDGLYKSQQPKTSMIYTGVWQSARKIVRTTRRFSRLPLIDASRASGNSPE